ncbi:MAG: hypothetical protein FGM33_06350 [Candidatus Kapabacteria bacterium]|nr:hypothetical protein [Candidatus Kapabacteria bacterium]
MKMTKTTLGALSLLLAGMILTSCGSEPTTPEPPFVSTTRLFSNVTTDSVTKWTYVSLDSMKVVEPGSANWDVRLPYIYCCGRTKAIPIQLNSGTNGNGSVVGAVVPGRFETITGIPAGVTLRTDDTTRPVVALPVLGGEAFFIYDIASHTLRPSPDKTLLVKSLTGKLYKFSVTSIYKDAATNPTQETPIGFYHFRVANLTQ